jgi:hypothetical protein
VERHRKFKGNRREMTEERREEGWRKGKRGREEGGERRKTREEERKDRKRRANRG